MTAPLYLDKAPPVFLTQGLTVALCIARIHDPAPNIGNHVRGLAFVGYNPRTLRVCHMQRIALCDDSDAVNYSALWPEYAALLAVSTPPHGETLASVEEPDA